MDEDRNDLDKYILDLVDLMSEDRQGVSGDKFWKMKITQRGIAGKFENQRSKNRRLYMKKIDQ
jgi:hypothetical protein